MRVVFMGTPALARRALEALYESGHEIPLVVTQPDKPKGRGGSDMTSPVKDFAVEKGLEVFQPFSLRVPETIEKVRDAKAEVIVVAAYGKMLPPELLDAAPLGCLNIHTSLLPAWRGAAPIQWALLNGDPETGVTIMKMDEGLDTGPILLRERLAIPHDMDYGGLYQALTEIGAQLLLRALPMWAEGRLTPRPQPAEGVSHAPKVDRTHEVIDWARPATDIHNQIRAFSPSPGATARIGDREIKVQRARALGEDEAPMLGHWQAEHADVRAATQAETPDTGLEGVRWALPGEIVGVMRHGGPVVACGEGYLLLTRLQPEGKKPMDGWSWINGSRVTPGQFFG